MSALQPRHFWRTATAAVCTLVVGCDSSERLPADVLSPEFQAPLLAAGADPIPDRYIVVLNERTPNAAAVAAQLVGAHGGELHFTYENTIKGFATTMPTRAIEALRRNPNVSYVVPDGRVQATLTQPNATWGLDRIDQRGLPLSTTYTYERTGTGVTAYVIDTGIRTTHGEFGGRARVGHDLFQDGRAGQDCNGHGTHVAGTIGGYTYGVAKDVRLVAVRVLDCSGYGSWSGVIAGVDWVTASAVKPAVANMSLGGGANAAMDDAIRRSILSGITYVIAAGNDNMDACNYSPARTLEAITVGATSSDDARSYFSNWGACVDIFAPGSAITSAWYSSDTALLTIDGTSMAAPHVAGVAALYLQGDPGATPATVAGAILNSASRSRVSNVGAGSPNLFLYSPLIAEAPAPLIELSQTSLVFSVAPGSAGSAMLAGPASATTPGTLPSWSAMARNIRPAPVRAAAARVVGSGAGPRKEDGATAAASAAMDANAAATASAPVSVKNSGTTTLDWTGSSDRGWLTLSSTGGSLAPGQSTTLNVTVNGAGLASGTHVGTITIAGPGAANSPRTITVTLTVVPATVLQSAVPVTNLSGAYGSQVWYMINVPTGATQLTVTISGAAGTGDADLYVDRENAPSFSRWLCRPYSGGNNETCTFTGPNPGTWYIMLHGFSAYSGVSLTATVTMPPPTGRLVWQNTSSGERNIWLMNGTSWSGQSAALPTTPLAWQIAASADFDADGDHDLVWQNLSTGERAIWIMNGITWGGVYKMLPTTAIQWEIVGAANLTSDACPELVWQNRTTGERSVWVMNCSSYTAASQAVLPQMATEWDIAAVSDLTCDGKPDLVWQNTSSGEHAIWHMDGTAHTGQSSALPTLPVAWQIVAAADLSNDGRNDLVWQNTSTGQRAIWHMDCASWPGQYTLLPTMPVAWQIATAYKG